MRCSGVSRISRLIPRLRSYVASDWGNKDLVLWSLRDRGTIVKSGLSSVLGSALGLINEESGTNGWNG